MSSFLKPQSVLPLPMSPPPGATLGRSHRSAPSTGSDVLTAILVRGTLLSHNSLLDSALTPELLQGASAGSSHTHSKASGGPQHCHMARENQDYSAFAESIRGVYHTMDPGVHPLEGPSADAQNIHPSVAHIRRATTPVLSRGSVPRYTSEPPSGATPVWARPPALLVLVLSGSVAASLPYYDLSNYSRLLNTLNLLQLDESGQRVEGAHDARKHAASRSQGTPPLFLEQLNQVPPRFSRFILDQRASGLGPEAGSPRSPRSAAPLSRDISWLMDSQATVFSVRQRTAAAASERKAPTLVRRHAIRLKPGGRLDRLRLALRRLAVRLRRRFNGGRVFFASTRKASSTVRRQLTRRGPGRPAVRVSAPLANPGLGAEGGAQLVGALSDKLKALAGAAPEGVAAPGPEIPQDIALDTSEAPPPPPPPPHGLALHKRMVSVSPETEVAALWRQYLANVLALRIRLRQEVHLFQLLLADQSVTSMFGAALTRDPRPNNGRALSTRWLAAEILSHRASIVPGKSSSVESAAIASDKSYVNKSRMATSAASIIQTASDFSSSTGSKGFESETESVCASSVYSDEKIDRLQHVLNRRSMLGQMLDYDSDELASLASSAFSHDSHAARSTKTESEGSLHTDTQLVKRYGTLRRHVADKSSSSSHEPGVRENMAVMSRSPAISDLQAVSAAPDDAFEP